MFEPLIIHRGRAVPILVDNIDTDQIIPSREMKAVSREGLSDGLFAGWRYTGPNDRTLNKDFVLNKDMYAGATILIAGKNFGCGSSREHAVWALAEYGFRVIIAESFNKIFSDNCFRNGVLPVILDDLSVVRGFDWDEGVDVTVDLQQQTVMRSDQPDWRGSFAIDGYPKRLLLEGLDPIGLTLESKGVIDAFEETDRQDRPWIYTDHSAA